MSHEILCLGSDEKRPSPAEWSWLCAKFAANAGHNTAFWAPMAELIRHAQVFEFGDVPDERIVSESERGGDLWGRHLQLPYRAVLYWYTCLPLRSMAHEMPDVQSLRFCTLAVHPGDPSKDGGVTHAADFILDADRVVDARYAFVLIAAAEFHSEFSAARQAYHWNATAVMQTMGRAESMVGSLADGVAALSMMLATRGIPLRREEPPAKVNAKRVKNGKPLLVPVTHVDSQRYYEAMDNTHRGGTHASPAPHLRRGHRRTYDRGTSDERTIWIRDMMVNCRSLDEIRERDHYEVEA